MRGCGCDDSTGDGLEPRAGASRDRVDVHEQLLAGGECLAALRVRHRVEEVHALLVRVEHLRHDLKRLESGDLAQVPEVRLDRVRAVAALEVLRVEPDAADARARAASTRM